MADLDLKPSTAANPYTHQMSVQFFEMISAIQAGLIFIFKDQGNTYYAFVISDSSTSNLVQLKWNDMHLANLPLHARWNVTAIQ